jgi:S1-C subfamily serine protease
VNRFRLIAAAALAAAVAAGASGGAHATTTPSPKPTTGVVLITTNLAYQNADAAGTGVVLTKNGEIVTNNHVIRGATTITVIVPSSGRRYPADVLGYDVADDIALLKVNASGMTTATRGNSGTLKIGAKATAVGNANGGGRLVITHGTVSALNRTITVRDDDGGTSTLSGLIRHSASIVPGDSGGPLLDAKNRVIGIDAAGSSVNSGDGYAIPINKAYTLVKQIETGKPSSLVHIGKTAFIGMSVTAANAGGLTVTTVVPGMPAASAGLDQGFVITALDGQQLSSVDVLRTALFSHHPGDTVVLAYIDPLGNQGHASIVLADGPPQ